MATLLTTRRFLPLFLTQFFGAFNDNLLKNALIILVAFRAITVFGIPPDQMVALAGGIFILPFFIFSAFAGILADQYDKARIIFWVKVSELLIMVLATVGFISPHFPLLLLTLFLMGVHSTFFGPLKYSILPQLLRPGELVAGNAWVEAGTFVAILLGTISGGILVSVPNGTVWVCVGLVIVAILGLLSCRFILPAPPSATGLKASWDLITPTFTILKMIQREKFLRRILLANSWFWFFGAIVLSLFPLIGKNVLHANEGVVTLFLSIFSVGVGIGSILCGRLSHQRATTGMSMWGLAGMAFFSWLMYVSLDWSALRITQPVTMPSFVMQLSAWPILIAFLGIAVSGGFYIVPLYTLMQERSSNQMRSRVIAANNIINAFFMVIAAVFLALLLGKGLSIAHIFCLLAGMNALSSILIFRLN